MRPYSPGGVLIAFTPARQESIPATPSTHRLPPGLPGYLIPFAPPAFEPQRQTQSSKPPSPLVFLPISTHFTATPGIPLASPALKICSFPPITDITSELLSETCKPACAPFTPNNSGQRLPPTYYRGCWHVVSRGLFTSYRLYLSNRSFVRDKRALRAEALLHSRGVAPSGFRPLWNIPHCCLP